MVIFVSHNCHKVISNICFKVVSLKLSRQLDCLDFDSEISLIHPASLKYIIKSFQLVLKLRFYNQSASFMNKEVGGARARINQTKGPGKRSYSWLLQFYQNRMEFSHENNIKMTLKAFLGLTSCFRITPDWLWQELC